MLQETFRRSRGYSASAQIAATAKDDGCDSTAPQQRSFALSVIVPFRDEGRASWFLPRLEELCRMFPQHPEIEFIVVDSGSHAAARRRCADICRRENVRYLYHQSEGQVFSIGAVRDFGARCARGKAITFFDIDWRVPNDFWARLLDFMAAFGTSRYKKAFFTIPALYLTEGGTAAFNAECSSAKFQRFFLMWMHGDTRLIQNMAACSSVAVIDRLHYLSRGGHRPEFRGHGYEDFELYHRLTAEDGILPRANDYYRDTRNWEASTYNGFRAQFALLGRAAMLANLFVVHLWHPRPDTLSFYSPANMRNTRDIWMEMFKEFDRAGEHPVPLIDASVANDRVLIFGEPRTNLVRCLRDVLPLLGQPVFVSEFEYLDEDGNFLGEEFEATLQHHGCKAVVFNAPYGNEARLRAYEWCRQNRWPMLVFERGALPDSWFFDPSGFNADSRSYQRRKWNRRLSTAQREDAIAYIQRCLGGGEALEAQGASIGGEALRSKLKLDGKKVLFVPLQRPSDSVIRHMIGRVGSFERFVQQIDDAALHLRRYGWEVICKKHPLETTSPPLNHASYVADDTHFIDLLEMADSVALINSGVGLYAMMMGKPCFIFGKAFYAFDDINKKVRTGDPKETARMIMEGHSVDMESVFKFIHYLKNEFYSFGRAEMVTRAEADGSLRSLTRAIDFYEIGLPGLPRISYEIDDRPAIPTWAPLFERYKLDLFQKKQQAQKGVAPTAKPAAAPKPAPAAPEKTRVLPSKGTPTDGSDHAQVAKTAALKNGALQATRNANAAKWAKLRKDPYRFFDDSRIGVLRPVRHLFARAAR